MSTFSPSQFGAALDGVTNDRPALQNAIDAAHRAGGGTVAIPAGRMLLTGSIILKTNVDLHLEPGARLVAKVDPFDYHSAAFIEAFHAENVSITGTGEIDGRGVAFMGREHEDRFEAGTWRPRLARFENCRRVRVLNVTLRDSAEAAIHLSGCEDAVVRGISILNNAKIGGSDGIVADCSRGLRISDCLVESGGDCICLRASPGSTRYGPCEHVLVRDCILATSGAAFTVGPDTAGNIRNVVFSDSIIRRCHRGVAVLLRDEGNIENIFVHNLVVQSQLFAPSWRGAAEPVCLSARPRIEHGQVGRMRRIRISDLAARGEGGVFLEGSRVSPITDVRFENVSVEIAKTTPWPARRDVRPPDERGMEDAVTAGFHLVDAEHVILRDCSVAWDPNPPACYGPAVRSERVEHLRLEHFRGHDAHFGEKKLILA